MKVPVICVFDDERYKNFMHGVIKDPSGILEDYKLPENTVLTFARISKDKHRQAVKHSAQVQEIVTSEENYLIGTNIICAYFEDEEMDLDLLKSISLRIQSRFRESTVIFKRVSEFLVVEC